jgi:CRISPR-associated protein Csm1
MDVDNLGQIFINGFSQQQRTYSRYTALSRNLDYFFKGYLSHLWQKKPYCDYSSIVYAGGDDLFIVGKWDEMIRMAEEIKNDFREWTCHNPGLSLSGGIAVVPVKFPVMKGAGEAGEAEELAKEHKIQYAQKKAKEKNAFTLFSYPLHWEIEYPIVYDYKEAFKREVSEKKHLPRGIFGRVYSYMENAAMQNHRINNLRVLWLMAYDFGRMAKGIHDRNSQSFLQACQKNVYTNSLNGRPNPTSYHFLELLYLAARWAELEIRTENI